MRRTSEELEKAARDAEAWLDSLDPTTTPAERIDDVRAIADANDRLVDARRDVRAAVLAARESGRSWKTIGRALGVSAQAAQQLYSGKKRRAVPKKVKRAPRKGVAKAPAKKRAAALKQIA